MDDRAITGMGQRTVAWLIALVLAAGPLLGLPMATIAGANPPIVVRTIADPGDGDCATNGCTLREAIALANTQVGADTINFSILGGGVQSIAPTSPLPEITGRVTIDGYTQAEAAPNTLPLATEGTNAQLRIVLDGTNAGADAPGLALGPGAAKSLVKGLVINHFDADGIRVDADEVKIEGNLVGADAAGTTGAGNGGSGIQVDSNGVIVGGIEPGQRNLISDHTASGNQGILIHGDDVVVQGNVIGSDRFATGDLGNHRGINIFLGKNALIGGKTAAAGNVIAFNDERGIVLFSPTTKGNRFLSNSIFANGGLGIDIGPFGPDENDKKDADTGANRGQNYPSLGSLGSNGGDLILSGQMNSSPDSTFIIQFFSTPPADGDDEGKTLLGQITVKTNKKGKANWEFTRAMIATPTNISMTATNKRTGDTSEFSPGYLMT